MPAIADNTHNLAPSIPTALNLFLVAIVSAIYFVLLGVSPIVPGGWKLCLLCILFAITMIPTYSLLHEAAHGILHPSEKVNYALGLWLGALFMAPFTFIRRCHIGHHRRNRSDFEMFDLYYPTDNKVWKNIYLVLLRIGFFWLALPVSVITFALRPRLFESKLFHIDPAMKAMIKGVNSRVHSRIRIEAIIVIAFHILVFLLLNLSLLPYVLMFLTHAFVWSSQNYVNHAFSPREVLHGAHNHRLPRLLGRYWYLNFHLHLAHHENPRAPWIHLDQFVSSDAPRQSYWKAWFELWRGVRLTTEPPPRPMDHFFNDVKELR